MSRIELIQKLRSVEETLLLELLEITSDEIVDRFIDKIADNELRIRKEIEE